MPRDNQLAAVAPSQNEVILDELCTLFVVDSSEAAFVASFIWFLVPPVNVRDYETVRARIIKDLVAFEEREAELPDYVLKTHFHLTSKEWKDITESRNGEKVRRKWRYTVKGIEYKE